jgi:hypothetical protein
VNPKSAAGCTRRDFHRDIRPGRAARCIGAGTPRGIESRGATPSTGDEREPVQSGMSGEAPSSKTEKRRPLARLMMPPACGGRFTTER